MKTKILIYFLTAGLGTLLILSFLLSYQSVLDYVAEYDLGFLSYVFAFVIVATLVVSLALSTDKFLYLFGVLVRFPKTATLKNIFSLPTDPLTFAGQFLVLGLLCGLCVQASYTLSSKGMAKRQVKQISEIQNMDFTEISMKFQAKETEIKAYYDELISKVGEGKLSLQQVQAKEERKANLEKQKANELNDLAIQKAEETRQFNEMRAENKELKQEIKANSVGFGVFLELFIIALSACLQILNPEIAPTLTANITQNTEISAQNGEIAPQLHEISLEQKIVSYIPKLDNGDLTQVQLAAILGTSEAKVSRTLKTYRETMKPKMQEEDPRLKNFF